MGKQSTRRCAGRDRPDQSVQYKQGSLERRISGIGAYPPERFLDQNYFAAAYLFTHQLKN